MKPNQMIFALILALAFVGSTYLCSPAARADEIGWQQVQSQDGRFSVQMPGQPTYEVSKEGSPAGDIQEHQYSYQKGPEVFTVEYQDVPGIATFFSSAKGIMNRAEKGFLKHENATATNQRDLAVGKHKGREVEWTSADHHGILQLYMVGKRLYVVDVRTPTAVQSHDDFQHFLSSFRVWDKGSIATP